MKVSDLKELSSEELIQKEKAFKKELFDLNYERKMGRVEKPNRFRVIKRDIARIMTILQQRKLEKE
jgi:large subunit ribosomal protein L29